MCLPKIWIDIAELIGVDHFLAMWRRLDREPNCQDAQLGMLLIRLRPYNSYLKFQRNRYVETLHAAGLKPKEIRSALQERLGEQISSRHISRLLQKK